MAGASPQEHTGKGGKKALDAELNLVPFIDLLSCCISFLLITAVWTQIAGLQISSSGGPPDPQAKESTVDVRLGLGEKGYQLTVAGAVIEIPKLNGAFDRQALSEKLRTLKASLPEQSAITVQPEDSVAYSDLVETVDAAMGEQLKNVTVAPAQGD
ncbi:MAG TPA: biopolymer transporter ExbD [Myxococcales bacterium]|nr:biopolymer transporter ExbD [Myxococcales bacterium]